MLHLNSVWKRLIFSNTSVYWWFSHVVEKYVTDFLRLFMSVKHTQYFLVLCLHFSNNILLVRSKLLTATVMKRFVFYDATQCNLVKANRHFRGTHQLTLIQYTVLHLRRRNSLILFLLLTKASVISNLLTNLGHLQHSNPYSKFTLAIINTRTHVKSQK
jgi:hypothetical protein